MLTHGFAGGAGITIAALLTKYDLLSTVAVTFISAGIAITARFVSFPFCKAIWIHLVYPGRGRYEE